VSAQQFPDRAKPVTVQVGSSEKDVHLFYTIAADGKVIEQGAADKSNELLNRKFTYKNEYANGLALTFAWVKNGKVYQHTTTIRRPLPDKQLRMKWETFRDRLTPGQQEEWTVSVASPKGEPLGKPAQLMAVLFDESLDQLANHQWSLSPFISLHITSLQWNRGMWGGSLLSGSYQRPYLNVDELSFIHFDKSCFPEAWLFYDRRVVGLARGKALKMTRATADVADYKAMSADESLQGRIAGLDVANEASPESVHLRGAEEAEEATDDAKAMEQPQTRQNLQEQPSSIRSS
jgi:hypothetical protein